MGSFWKHRRQKPASSGPPAIGIRRPKAAIPLNRELQGSGLDRCTSNVRTTILSGVQPFRVRKAHRVQPVPEADFAREMTSHFLKNLTNREIPPSQKPITH
jgi:hypothetical protein